MKTEVYVLADDRRVKYSLKSRTGDSYLFVVFMGPDGRRKEISTSESNKKRARESAVALIVQSYQPKKYIQDIGWDRAIEMLEREWTSANLRPNTIATYGFVINTLREVFPKSTGPSAITEAMAKQYKIARMSGIGIKKKDGVGAETVRGDLMELKTIFGKWMGKACGILDSNPFADIEPPKVDEKPRRIIAPDERDALLTWLSTYSDGWRLPRLFLEVKSCIGCRIAELATMPTRNLKDGRLVFDAGVTKSRKARACKLPEKLYAELLNIAGPTYIFEKFPDQLRDLLLRRNKPHHAKSVKFPYDPTRLVNWLQDRLVEFREDEANKDVPYFKLHNFRGTAMSRARQGGASYDEAAIAFGCNPATMRHHYESLDEVAISDDVMDRVHGGSVE